MRFPDIAPCERIVIQIERSEDDREVVITAERRVVCKLVRGVSRDISEAPPPPPVNRTASGPGLRKTGAWRRISGFLNAFK